MIKFIFLLLSVLIIKKLRLIWWELAILIIGVIILLIIEIPSVEKFHYFYREWGVDFIGFSLIILSFWIRLLIITSRRSILKVNYFKEYFLWLIISLLIVLIICFLTVNLMYFYFFFEVSLVPTLLIIMGWGYQLERLQAGVYFIFYTLTASLPLLLNLTYLYSEKGGINFNLIRIILIIEFKNIVGGLVILILIMAFLVKLPIFFCSFMTA